MNEFRFAIRTIEQKEKLKTNYNLLSKNDCEKRYRNGVQLVSAFVNPIHFAAHFIGKIKIEIAVQLRIVYIQSVSDPVLTVPKLQTQKSLLFWREEKPLPHFTRSVNLQRVQSQHINEFDGKLCLPDSCPFPLKILMCIEAICYHHNIASFTLFIILYQIFFMPNKKRGECEW